MQQQNLYAAHEFEGTEVTEIQSISSKDELHATQGKKISVNYCLIHLFTK